MLRVGLTGGIACGKTFIRQRLESLKIATLDLDQLSRTVVRPGTPGHARVVEAFGGIVLAPDGSIDRGALASAIFRDATARRRLNGILHPLVRNEERAALRRLEGAGALVAVVDAALLIEGGRHLRFDRLIVAHCHPELQLERLQRRDGLTRRDAASRIAAQLPGDEKLRFASYAVDTNGTKERTEEQVAAVGQALLGLRSAPAPAGLPSNESAVGALTAIRDERVAGVGPLELLQHIESQHGVDLQHLARLLRPSWDGDWYDAARGHASADGPERLTLPVVLWRLATKGMDRAGVLASAAAVARVATERPAEIAEACLLADAACELVLNGALARDWREQLTSWRVEARKWGQASVPPRTARTLDEVSGAGARGAAAPDASEGGSAERVGEALRQIAGRVPAAAADAGIADAWRRVLEGIDSEAG